MTVNKRPKKSRQRGKHTHGWGAKKKHRGAGNRGGRGNAGTGKRADHKKELVQQDKYYFGKHGFVNPTTLTEKAINLQTLQNSLNHLKQKNIVEYKDGFYVIDLKKIGYDKLLSKGVVKNKFIVLNGKVTENAKKKIEEAGGKVEILKEQKED